MTLRFTIVVPRYGLSILGGAEKHARMLAEHLVTRGHDVRVLTTRASDYRTWANDLPVGRESINGVSVERFDTARTRSRPFDQIAKSLTSRWRRSRSLTEAWYYLQGPVTPGLLERLESEARERDLIVFFQLLQHATFQGLKQIGHRSVLVPLVHDEPPIYTHLARSTLSMPRALLVNTEEEQLRIQRLVRAHTPASAVVGVGVENPQPLRSDVELPCSEPYLLILGRLAKTRPMLRLWRELVANPNLPPFELPNGHSVPWSAMRLVTVGERSALYTKVPNVIALPFVDDDMRWQLIWHAAALVNPSVLESLSLVLLEAWACSRPVIVNARCDVTAGQCMRSRGGFAVDFERPSRGARQIADALASPAARLDAGRRGHQYVQARYSWPRVTSAFEAVALALRHESSVQGALDAWHAAADQGQG